MKFSIIIPVYNVEKYIEKCLISILEQGYSNYEVIIVNDGSKDCSQKIIDKFINKDSRFKSYIKENGGLSDARNFGLNYVTGDYILFLDSDDYLEKELLQKLYDSTSIYPVDMVCFGFQKVDEKGTIITQITSKEFSNYDMDDALSLLLEGDCIEPAWRYMYRTNFFLDNGFLYPKGYYHEDYGLTPYILLKAKKISSISYIGLNYVQRLGSIMNSDNYNKTVEKTDHVYRLFVMQKEKIEKLEVSKVNRKQVMAFLARVLLEQLLVLKNEQWNEYVKKLEKLGIEQYFCQKGIKGFIKKIWAKVHFFSYCKHFYGGI